MDRTGFLGGSDAAVIAGLSPFKDADTLLLEKAGLVAPDDSRFAGHRTWGQLIEPVVLDFTAAQLGAHEIAKPPAPLIHPSYPFIRAALDGLITLDDVAVGIYEGKTTAHSQRDKWKTDPPPEYRIQCVHNMMVAGVEWAVIAVLIGGNDYRRYEIHRDPEEEALLLTLELRFWEKVQALRAQQHQEIAT